MQKFSSASANLYRLFVKAEGLLAFNNPAMMVAIYFCIIMVSWLGAQLYCGRQPCSSGDLTSLFSYVMALLMSLMMLSMVIVMISMSMASIRRISEVLRGGARSEGSGEPGYRKWTERRHRFRPCKLLPTSTAAGKTL